jgi:glycopeptide antibiotics resistance protein
VPGPCPSIARIVTAAYVFALFVVTVAPFRNVSAEFCRHQPKSWQLNPLQAVERQDAAISELGVLGALLDDAFVDAIVNVLLFVPLGVLLAWRSRLSVPAITAVSLAISIVIEVIQGTAVLGLFTCAYRQADVYDVITNTAGALLGAVLARRQGAAPRPRSTRPPSS